MQLKFPIVSLLILLTALQTAAQRRFYFSATAAPDISPTFGNGSVWNVTGDGIRRKMSWTKDNSTLTSKTSSSTSGTGNYLMYQLVSDPLQAATVSGATIKGQLRANASSTSGSPRLSTAVTMFIVDGSGNYKSSITTSSGTSGSGDYTTTLTNRFLWNGTQTLSDFTLADGDRIVFEIGFNQHFASQARTVTQRIGNSAASDLAQDETSTTDNNPWIEFSYTFQTYTPTAKSRRVRIMN